MTPGAVAITTRSEFELEKVPLVGSLPQFVTLGSTSRIAGYTTVS
jgi:hypothetical protein